MKRFAIVLLLTVLALGQSVWLLAPGASASLQEVETADVSLTETAEASITPTATDEPLPTETHTPTSTPVLPTSTTAPEPTSTSTTAPADPTNTVPPAATETPTYKNIEPGDTIRIDTAVLNVRSGTSTSTPVVAQVQQGQTFTVLEGPLRANGYDWIRIDMGAEPNTPAADRWIAAQYVVLAVSASPSSTPTVTNTPDGSATAPADPTGTPTYKNIKPGDTIRVDTALLNVRSSASTSGSIVGQVEQGQTFTVLEGPTRVGSYDWIRIAMSGTSSPRWIAAQYVVLEFSASTSTPSVSPTASRTPTITSTPDGSATATATASPTVQIVAGDYQPGNTIVVTAALNVRTGPGTSNSILKVASAGEQGIVQTGNTPGGAYEWAQVKFGTLTGWVAVNYIDHLSMTTPTPAPGVWLLSLTLDCYSSPERIMLANSSSSSVQIISITTHYDVGPGEPWVLNHTLGANQTRTYLTGAGASGAFALTTSYRLTNAAGAAEGVTIETSLGTVQRSCPAVSSGERWVEINLSSQYMTVWQGNTRVTGTYVSTGRPGFDTPTGTFRTWLRYVSQTMSGCIQGECYVVPNVPYVHYFTYGGHALHGAYWHNNFGTVRSHGCVNLPVPFSEWLYYWLPMNSRVVIHY